MQPFGRQVRNPDKRGAEKTLDLGVYERDTPQKGLVPKTRAIAKLIFPDVPEKEYPVQVLFAKSSFAEIMSSEEAAMGVLEDGKLNLCTEVDEIAVTSPCGWQENELQKTPPVE